MFTYEVNAYPVFFFFFCMGNYRYTEVLITVILPVLYIFVHFSAAPYVQLTLLAKPDPQNQVSPEKISGPTAVDVSKQYALVWSQNTVESCSPGIKTLPEVSENKCQWKRPLKVLSKSELFHVTRQWCSITTIPLFSPLDLSLSV